MNEDRLTNKQIKLQDRKTNDVDGLGERQKGIGANADLAGSAELDSKQRLKNFKIFRRIKEKQLELTGRRGQQIFLPRKFVFYVNEF